jgi:hypothetical protein
MRLRQPLNRVGLLIALLVISFSLSARERPGSRFLPQSKNKTVDEVADPKEPIQNLGIKVGGRHVKLSEEFENGHDWLKDVTFEIKNKSNKTIVYIETDLAFFETQATGTVMLFPLRKGHRPWQPGDARFPALRLEPGQVTELPISGSTLESLKNFLAQRHPLGSLKKATLRLEMVVFDDGMAWAGGGFRCADPNRIGSYYPVSVERCP